MFITLPRLQAFAPHGQPDIIRAVADHGEENLIQWGLNTERRCAHLMAHIYDESNGLTEVEENLNYSARRLCQVWPARFPILAAALPFAHNPKALADKVYDGRMGNRPWPSDDGWLNRGEGLLQTTGKDNRIKLGHLMKLDMETDPSPLVSLPTMFSCACAQFVLCGAVGPADRDNLVGTTQRVNGGQTNFQDRHRALIHWRSVG